jgi:hypothetical protein
MAFIAIELAIQLVTNLAPIEDAVRPHRKKLADEIARSSRLDRAQPRRGPAPPRRRPRPRLPHRPRQRRRAHGALRQALARRLITEQQYADVDRILDQLRAILWRLTH